MRSKSLFGLGLACVCALSGLSTMGCAADDAAVLAGDHLDTKAPARRWATFTANDHQDSAYFTEMYGTPILRSPYGMPTEEQPIGECLDGCTLITIGKDAAPEIGGGRRPSAALFVEVADSDGYYGGETALIQALRVTAISVEYGLDGAETVQAIYDAELEPVERDGHVVGALTIDGGQVVGDWYVWVRDPMMPMGADPDLRYEPSILAEVGSDIGQGTLAMTAASPWSYPETYFCPNAADADPTISTNGCSCPAWLGVLDDADCNYHSDYATPRDIAGQRDLRIEEDLEFDSAILYVRAIVDLDTFGSTTISLSGPNGERLDVWMHEVCPQGLVTQGPLDGNTMRCSAGDDHWGVLVDILSDLEFPTDGPAAGHTVAPVQIRIDLAQLGGADFLSGEAREGDIWTVRLGEVSPEFLNGYRFFGEFAEECYGFDPDADLLTLDEFERQCAAAYRWRAPAPWGTVQQVDLVFASDVASLGGPGQQSPTPGLGGFSAD